MRLLLCWFPDKWLHLSSIRQRLPSLLLLYIAVSLLNHHNPMELLAQEPVPYGPRLFFIAGHDQMPRPTQALYAVHLRLQQESRWSLIASGDSRAEAALVAAGYQVILLDSETRGKVYYLLEAQTQPEIAREIATAFGRILYSHPSHILIAVTKMQELQLVEQASLQGIGLSLLNPEPLPLEMAELATHATTTRAITTAEPLIRTLLPQMTDQVLAERIRQLSGELPVSLGDDDVTIDSRYTFSQRIQDAERYLYEYHKALGMNPHYVEWTYGNYSGRNIIVDIPGTEHPERIWVIGGHFDSMSDTPYTVAPGADDNASGVAVTMRIAEILRAYQFADTIRFVYFSGEEQGQWGSIRYVRDLSAAGAEIQGYINLDMIGYDGDGDGVVELHTGSPTSNPSSNTLATAFVDASKRYEQGLNFERKTDGASRFSDHRSFWDYQYPAFLVIENFFTDDIPPDRNPNYHRNTDRLDVLTLDYTVRIGRTALATIAELAGIQQKAATPTVTPTPTSLACQDLLLNGGFEETATSAWTFAGAYPATIVDSPVYAGERSLQIGVPDTDANRTAYSTAYQSVTVPNWPERVLLKLWQQRHGSADGSNAWTISLLDSNYLPLEHLEQDKSSGDGTWQQRSFDVSEFKGREIVVYLSVYNNGSGSQMWGYVDDIALLACTQPTPTATPTASVTPSGQANYLPAVLNYRGTPIPTSLSTVAAAIATPTNPHAESQ